MKEAEPKFYIKKNNELPDDTSFYYLVAENGLFMHKNTPIYEAIVPASKIYGLAAQDQVVKLKIPLISKCTVEMILGFQHMIWKKYRSESIVLIYYSVREEKCLFIVPHQYVDFWEKGKHGWSYFDLKYNVPFLPGSYVERGYSLIGDWHSHGAWTADHSIVDENDENFASGLHIISGRLNREDPEIACYFVLNDLRIRLDTDDVLEEFECFREPPDNWIQRVHKKSGGLPGFLSSCRGME
jgi:hypothetical protein